MFSEFHICDNRNITEIEYRGLGSFRHIATIDYLCYGHTPNARAPMHGRVMRATNGLIGSESPEAHVGSSES